MVVFGWDKLFFNSFSSCLFKEHSWRISSLDSMLRITFSISGEFFFLMVPIVWRLILATEWYFLTGFLYERLATVLATKISSKSCFKKSEMYDFWTDKCFGTFVLKVCIRYKWELGEIMVTYHINILLLPTMTLFARVAVVIGKYCLPQALWISTEKCYIVSVFNRSKFHKFKHCICVMWIGIAFAK